MRRIVMSSITATLSPFGEKIGSFGATSWGYVCNVTTSALACGRNVVLPEGHSGWLALGRAGLVAHAAYLTYCAVQEGKSKPNPESSEKKIEGSKVWTIGRVGTLGAWAVGEVALAVLAPKAVDFACKFIL
jgi:hypothetical protein